MVKQKRKAIKPAVQVPVVKIKRAPLAEKIQELPAAIRQAHAEHNIDKRIRAAARAHEQEAERAFPGADLRRAAEDSVQRAKGVRPLLEQRWVDQTARTVKRQDGGYAAHEFDDEMRKRIRDRYELRTELRVRAPSTDKAERALANALVSDVQVIRYQLTQQLHHCSPRWLKDANLPRLILLALKYNPSLLPQRKRGRPRKGEKIAN